MGSKKKNKTTSTTNQSALKIGSRIRCTDDGVEGRIVWANGVSVKVKWDDGEQVTWKRDSLATRPIEILDADSDDQIAAPAVTDAAEGITTATEVEQPAAPADAAGTEPTATAEQPQAEPETTPATTESTAAEPATIPEATVEQATPSTEGAGASNAKPKRQRKAPAAPKEKKVSALDAAAKVLAEEGRPMTCKELIAAMAIKGYWASPGGKTPDATLYSAILREIDTKGAEARFVKVGRGQFGRKA